MPYIKQIVETSSDFRKLLVFSIKKKYVFYTCILTHMKTEAACPLQPQVVSLHR